MFGTFVSLFVHTWLIGFIALVLGRYIGTTPANWPPGVGGKLVVYLQVWAVTFLAQLVFGYLGKRLSLEEHIQSGFAKFFVPIAIGAIFTRQLLLRQSSKRV